MYDKTFYEYGVLVFLLVIFMAPMVGMVWIEWTVDWRWERKMRKKRQKAAKAKRQQAAA